MTSKRERDYARRRYEKYQERQRERARAARRRQRIAVAAVAGGAVVALVAVGLVVALGSGEDEVDPAALDLAQEPAATEPAADRSPGSATSQCPRPAPGAREDVVEVSDLPPEVRGPVRVTLTTSCGDIAAELDGDAAPVAVGSFVGLSEAGFFAATPCHRLTTSGIHVLQCGDPTGSGTGGPGYRFGPVENAPDDDVYPAGTLAMARAGDDGESMGSQFFIVYEDSTIPSDAAGGYTVMGRVTSGLDVVRAIAEAGVGPDGVGPAQTVGLETVGLEVGP